MASNPVDDAAAAAEAARTRVSATIEDIQTRLDPRRVMGDAVSRVQTGSRALANQASEAAKAHPLAIGAGAAAVVLALFARNKLASATVNLGDGTANYTDYDDGYADDAGIDTAISRPQPVMDDMRESVGASPGVAILVGLAAGAALGALLPVTDAERRTLGETGDRIGAAARAAARRAAEEFDGAGLSLGSVKAKAGEAGRKARDAAKSVADAARAELKAPVRPPSA